MIKQNQTPRSYITINGFDIRAGMAYNYNPTITKQKFEIRIQTEDFDLGEALFSKIKEWLK